MESGSRDELDELIKSNIYEAKDPNKGKVMVYELKDFGLQVVQRSADRKILDLKK